MARATTEGTSSAILTWASDENLVPKFLEQVRDFQEAKYGRDRSHPLLSVLDTPIIPLIVVRYTFVQGKSKVRLLRPCLSIQLKFQFQFEPHVWYTIQPP